MAEIPMFFILYFDALLRRKAFAGPYDHVPEADAARLSKAGNQDVEFVRTRDIAPWMPALRFAGPGHLGCTGPEVRKADGILRVVADWDAVERAFPGQLVEATACDGEEFHGCVTEVDVAGCLIWIDVY
jgi:hypothetical protein